MDIGLQNQKNLGNNKKISQEELALKNICFKTKQFSKLGNK